MQNKELPEVKVGEIVSSKNGRFKGELFVVIGIEDEYLYLANGKKRKVTTPKKKKIKHCNLNLGFSEHTAKKILAGEKVTNNELRITLGKIINQEDVIHAKR